MSFSDQQIVTGISVLIGGFSQLQWGISAYHWQSIVNLAWLSTVTHLLTLTILREEVHSNKPVRNIRVLGMGLLVLKLFPAMLPIGCLLLPDKLPEEFPAWCLYHPSLKWYNRYNDQVVISYN